MMKSRSDAKVIKLKTAKTVDQREREAKLTRRRQRDRERREAQKRHHNRYRRILSWWTWEHDNDN